MNINKIRKTVIISSIICTTLVVVVICLVLIKKNSLINDAHAYIVVGKVIEIRDDNVVLLEITKQRAEDYKIGDKILVKYKESYWHVTKDDVGEDEAYDLQLGDEIYIQNPSKISKVDGYDLLEVDKATKDEIK